MDREELLAQVQEKNISIIRFQWMGNDLTQRAMATTPKFLGSHLDSGIGIARGMQSFNALDELVPEGAFGPADSEFRLMPDLSTYSELPYARRTARLIAELWNLDGTPNETDGRSYLRRIIDEAKGKGYLPFAALETEFYLLKWENGAPIPYINEKFGTTHGYDLLSEYMIELTENLSSMGVNVERLKKEYGHSQIEPTLRYSNALKAADDMITLKDVAKGIAAKRGIFASFMPKPFQGRPGNGMHIHLSLFDGGEKNNLFYSKTSELSETGRYFVGGVMTHMKGICIFGAPISNSYKRILPHTWSPAHVSWGYDNRAVALRIPSTKNAREKRVEYRLPDSAANPYLALAIALAAGLDGISNKIEPPDPIMDDPAELSESELSARNIETLPRTLGEALETAKADPWVRKTVGGGLFDEYLKVRNSEWKVFREHVSEWEVTNYIESI